MRTVMRSDYPKKVLISSTIPNIYHSFSIMSFLRVSCEILHTGHCFIGLNSNHHIYSLMSRLFDTWISLLLITVWEGLRPCPRCSLMYGFEYSTWNQEHEKNSWIREAKTLWGDFNRGGGYHVICTGILWDPSYRSLFCQVEF